MQKRRQWEMTIRFIRFDSEERRIASYEAWVASCFFLKKKNGHSETLNFIREEGHEKQTNT